MRHTTSSESTRVILSSTGRLRGAVVGGARLVSRRRTALESVVGVIVCVTVGVTSVSASVSVSVSVSRWASGFGNPKDKVEARRRMATVFVPRRDRQCRRTGSDLEIRRHDPEPAQPQIVQGAAPRIVGRRIPSGVGANYDAGFRVGLDGDRLSVARDLDDDGVEAAGVDEADRVGDRESQVLGCVRLPWSWLQPGIVG